MEHRESRSLRHRLCLLALPAAALLVVLPQSALSAAALPEAATDADATEVNAITHLEAIVDGDLAVWNDFRVYLEWEAPAEARAGDTFSLTFPEEIDGIATTIPLYSEQHNASAGSCVVTARALECRFNEVVEQYGDVDGWAAYTARTFAETPEDFLTWQNSFRDFTTVPGVGEQGPILPGSSWTSGWISGDGIRWEIVLAAEHLQHVEHDLALTNDYDDALTLNQDSFTVEYASEETWVSQWQWWALDDEDYTVTVDDDGFDLTLHTPVTDGSQVYRIQYTTALPGGVENGEVFTAAVGLTGRELSHSFEYVFGAGEWTGTAQVCVLGDVDWLEENKEFTAAADFEIGPRENREAEAGPALVPTGGPQHPCLGGQSAPAAAGILPATEATATTLALTGAILLVLAAVMIAEARRRSSTHA